MPDVVIAAYRRSPFHFAGKGALTRVRPDDLAAAVVKALVAEAGIDPGTLEDLIVGCAFPEGEQGLNVARLIGFIAGLPRGVAGVTVNRFCGSSMQAVHQAAGAIALGAGEAFVCAGVESMSRVPMGGYNIMPNPALAHDYPQAYISMGETAENVAQRYQVSRADQEAFAAESHRRRRGRRRRGAARRRDRGGRRRRKGRLHPPRHHRGKTRRPQARLPRRWHGHRGDVEPADRRCRFGSRLHRRVPRGRTACRRSRGSGRSRSPAACRRRWAWGRSAPPARRWPAPASPPRISTSSKSTRRSRARPSPACANSGSIRRRPTSTAAPLRSVTRSAPPARASSARPRRC